MACFKGFAELHNMQPFADTAFLLSPCLSRNQRRVSGIMMQFNHRAERHAIPANPSKQAEHSHDFGKPAAPVPLTVPAT
ncbi:hypothetical protein ACLUWU_08300 [Bifidobacterium thermophilum]|uniref:hypothetical protein n=1 Tax=Bifidobacterium thermophilum TaxID=33905 RepID=UPI0039943624